MPLEQNDIIRKTVPLLESISKLLSNFESYDVNSLEMQVTTTVQPAYQNWKEEIETVLSKYTIS